ncbi:MAG TPA: ABC transporter ATP-binding protein [Achromobacter sp.]|nr:ABC transporter ATP-binding protein [Achromobacter sp.]
MSNNDRDQRIGDVMLDMQNISLSFGGVKALTDISFNVREHEIRAIIGPNGAGKSSMLNVINGVYTPQKGGIAFRGESFSKMNPRRAAEMGIARTFQNLALFKGMSVLDNIMTGRNLRMKCGLLSQAFRLGPAEREETQHREFVENIVDFLEIQAYRKTPVGRLPYGLQKRVDLGRALAMEPRLLLLDEPMAGLGQEDVARIAALIRRVAVNRSILMVEHNLSVVADLSDTITVLARGAVLAQGDYAAVSRDERVITAYMGSDEEAH